MKIEQKTITTIVAEEGKLLVRKSDGWLAGEKVTLGYNYYEAGVALSNPKLELPDDYMEIDKPEDYETKPIINHVQRLKRTKELMERNVKEMNELNLSVKDALEVVEFFPEFLVDEGFKEGDTVTKGTKFKYNGKLYAVVQDHTILAHYYPSVDTASLYTEVVPEMDEEGNVNGTLENPIPYEGNMALENGKYYIQDGVVYQCTRNSDIAIYNKLADLIGIYVVEATTDTEEDSTGENEEVIVEYGTLENPIEYTSGITLESGKYYVQDNVTYLCNRDSGNPVYHNLSDLVGLYVEAV